MSSTPLFTVFTPTYNRAHTLERVRASLSTQTCHDFEWVVVDDGSTDGTEALMRGWIAENSFPIRYFRQANRGKHVAFNRGVQEALGELFVPLDSDDACVPAALDRLRAHWFAIPVDARDRFSGITCLCMDERGKVLGGPLPAATVDGRPFEVLSEQRRSAETWTLYRTAVLRAYPFPEYPGERFVAEGLVSNRIGRQYLSRFINEALRIYYDSPDSLSRETIRIRACSPRGAIVCYGEAIELPVRMPLRLRAAINLSRFAIGARRIRDALPYAAKHPFLVGASLVPGLVLALRDRAVCRK
jgi:glycosyltransferase involved in cell wall biosynthesis